MISANRSVVIATRATHTHNPKGSTKSSSSHGQRDAHERGGEGPEQALQAARRGRLRQVRCMSCACGGLWAVLGGPDSYRQPLLIANSHRICVRRSSSASASRSFRPRSSSRTNVVFLGGSAVAVTHVNACDCWRSESTDQGEVEDQVVKKLEQFNSVCDELYKEIVRPTGCLCMSLTLCCVDLPFCARAVVRGCSCGGRRNYST